MRAAIYTFLKSVERVCYIGIVYRRPGEGSFHVIFCAYVRTSMRIHEVMTHAGMHVRSRVVSSSCFA